MKSSSLELVNVPSCGKGDLADLIKGKDLESGLSWWALNVMVTSLIQAEHVCCQKRWHAN